MVRVDLDGSFYCCHAVLPTMRAQQGGLIANIASRAGKQVVAASGPAYTAVKFGVCAFTESINLEEGMHGIRATVVCPSEVDSPFLDKRPVPLSAGVKSERRPGAHPTGILPLCSPAQPVGCNGSIHQSAW